MRGTLTMSAPETPDSHDAAELTSGGRNRGLVVAGLFVVVLVVVGLLLVVLPSRDADPVVGGDVSAPAIAESVAEEPVAPGECDLPAGNQAVPAVAPADTEWELVGRVAAPTAPGVFGPAVTDPVRSCFARNPTGALYAAVNALATTTLPDAPRLLAEDLGAEGPGRDAALAQLPTDGSAVPADDSEGQIQVSGFQFLSYTENEAVIDLSILTVTNGQAANVHTAFTLRWERDDWRIVHAADGAPFSTIQLLPSVAGYVPWSGT